MASEKEKEAPGSFNSTLADLQETNNVPKFKLGNISVPASFQSFANPNAFTNSSSDIPIQKKVSNQGVLQLNERLDEATSIVDAASTSAECSLHEDVPERRDTSLKSPNIIQENSRHKISIIKKKACPSVSSRNIGDLLKRGMLIFETDSNLSQKQCLKYLNENLLECKSIISKAVIKDFLPDRSVNVS